jgi:hypothetical protein
MRSFQYLIVLGLCLVVTLPLEVVLICGLLTLEAVRSLSRRRQ